MKSKLALACIAMVFALTVRGLCILLSFSLLMLPTFLMFISGNVLGICVYLAIIGFIIGMCEDVLR